MSPSANSKSRYKLPYFAEEFLQNDEEFIPYIALTETWLKPYISNAQLTIENYHTIRADRIKRERGGTIIYIHNSIATTDEDSYDDDKCEVVICTVEAEKSIISSIYRPPDAEEESFKAALNFIQEYVDKQSATHH